MDKYYLKQNKMTTIRKARPEEWSIIADFQRKLALETENIILNPEVLQNGVQTVLKDSSKGCYFLAETDGRINGSLMITYEWSDWRNNMIYWIQSVYVLPEFRRRGIYRKLYEHVKNLALNTNGVGGIRLYVDNSNRPAQQTYTNLGMNGEHYKVFEWMKPQE